MSRLGRDKLREERFSRSRQVTGWIVLLGHCDPVKEIGQICDRSATVRPARRTLNRRMVTAEEPVYSTCSSKDTRRSNASTETHWDRPAPQPVHVLRAIGERTELSDGVETRGPAAIREEAAAGGRDCGRGDRQHAIVL